MNANRLIAVPVAVFALVAGGCVGTGPNTQQGAVGGATLGAIAGAIIGHQSGEAGAGALIGAAAGAVAGGTLGNSADHQRGTIYRSPEEATTNVVVEEVPPPPPPRREVVVVQSRPDTIWVPGYWAYTGRGRYVWVEGGWMVPPPHARRYVAPHWERRGHTHVYIEGYWRG